MSETPTIGHNSQAALDDEIVDIDPTKLAPPPEIVRAILDYNYPGVPEERDKLMTGIKAWIASHTAEGDKRPTIRGTEDLKLAKDFLNQIKEFDTKTCAPVHKLIKAAPLAAGRMIDDWFNKEQVAVVEAAAKPILDAYAARMIVRHRNARAVLQNVAAEAQMEAERLAAEAQQARDQDGQAELDRLAEEAADRACIAAAAATDTKAVDLTRIHTDLGRVGHVTTFWTFRVEQMMDLILAVMQGRQDLMKYLTINKEAVDEAIKTGVRSIPGLHIYEDEKVR